MTRPPDTLVTTEATRRLLWGSSLGAAGWLLLSIVDGRLPSLAAAGLAVCVVLFDAPGLGVAAVCAAVAVGQPHAPGRSVGVGLGVLVAGAALGPVARRLARRAGPLALDALILAGALAALAVGPVGVFLAPAGVAVVQAVLPPPERRELP